LELNFSVWNHVNEVTNLMVGEVNIPLSSIDLDDKGFFFPYILLSKGSNDCSILL